MSIDKIEWLYISDHRTNPVKQAFCVLHTWMYQDTRKYKYLDLISPRIRVHSWRWLRSSWAIDFQRQGCLMTNKSTTRPPTFFSASFGPLFTYHFRLTQNSWSKEEQTKVNVVVQYQYLDVINIISTGFAKSKLQMNPLVQTKYCSWLFSRTP